MLTLLLLAWIESTGRSALATLATACADPTSVSGSSSGAGACDSSGASAAGVKGTSSSASASAAGAADAFASGASTFGAGAADASTFGAGAASGASGAAGAACESIRAADAVAAVTCASIEMTGGDNNGSTCFSAKLAMSAARSSALTPDTANFTDTANQETAQRLNQS